MGFEIFVECTALQMPVEDEENDDVPELECNDMIFDHLENQDIDYDSQGQEPKNDSDGSYGDNDEEIAHDEEIRCENIDVTEEMNKDASVSALPQFVLEVQLQNPGTVMEYRHKEPDVDEIKTL
ncbi:hypothetical protein M569_13755, partial [Genlisea aurea]